MENVSTFVRKLFCFLLLMAAAFVASSATKKPNIIFILADDLGYTDLSCYGSKYYETPNLDRMAKQGIRFTDAHVSAPNCQPSRAAFMSGQYMARTGVYTVGSIERFDWRSQPMRPADNVTELPLDKITIAQALKNAGYATGMFGKWHLGEDKEHHPSARGFDEAITSMGVHFDFKTDPPTEYPKGEYLADFLTDKAVDFIHRHKDEPFFLYLPHYAVHMPLQAKENLIEKFKPKTPVGGHNNPVYAAMIASVDESAGRVLAALDELHLADNTLVIFSSDNGGVGGYAREKNIEYSNVTDNAPLRGGKGTLYEGGHREPYIFRWPGKIPANTVCDETIVGVDLYPTLLEIAGAKPAKGYPLDGVSYLKQLTSGGKAKLNRDAVYWHFPGYLGAQNNTWRTHPVSAIRSGDWKLMEFLEDGHLELYNLKDDLSEKNNLAAKNPAKAKELLTKLVAWRKVINAQMPTPNKDIQPPSSAKKGKKNKKAGNV